MVFELRGVDVSISTSDPPVVRSTAVQIFVRKILILALARMLYGAKFVTNLHFRLIVVRMNAI